MADRGGVMCPIDIKSGKIIAAADENGKMYDVHPDSKIPIIGFQVPKWNEAMEMAIELARQIPSNRYAGWDLALTKNGWLMIEGNARGQFVGWKIPMQKGFRKEWNELTKGL